MGNVQTLRRLRAFRKGSGCHGKLLAATLAFCPPAGLALFAARDRVPFRPVSGRITGFPGRAILGHLLTGIPCPNIERCDASKAQSRLDPSLRNPRSDGACAPRPSNHQAKGTCQVGCFHAAWSYLHLSTSLLRRCAPQCKGALLQESQVYSRLVNFAQGAVVGGIYNPWKSLPHRHQ